MGGIDARPRLCKLQSSAGMRIPRITGLSVIQGGRRDSLAVDPMRGHIFRTVFGFKGSFPEPLALDLLIEVTHSFEITQP